MDKDLACDYDTDMKYVWAMRLLVAMMIMGVSFGALTHPVMAGSANPMHADMPCCEPIVTAQDAAPSNAIAIVITLPVVIPSDVWRATINRPSTIRRPTLHLQKIPKQLSLVGSIFKRE